MVEFFQGKLDGIQFSFTYPYHTIDEPALDTGQRRAVAERLLRLKERYPEFVLNSDGYLEGIGDGRSCPLFLLIEVNARGNRVRGCIVDHIEPHDCARCDLGCKEMTHTFELDLGARLLWRKRFGIPFPALWFERSIPASTGRSPAGSSRRRGSRSTCPSRRPITGRLGGRATRDLIAPPSGGTGSRPRTRRGPRDPRTGPSRREGGHPPDDVSPGGSSVADSRSRSKRVRCSSVGVRGTSIRITAN